MHSLSTFQCNSLPARLVLLLLSTRTFLELLCLLERFLNRLAHLSLFLARLDRDSNVLRATFFRSFADSAFGILPICCARANFVPSILG
jgi:hypothetical protein